MIPLFQLSQNQISEKYIHFNSLDNLTDGEFVRITVNDMPSVLFLAQKSSHVSNEGITTSIARLVYRSDIDLYPIFYYAVGRIMYHSLMYLRHLPLGRFNRFIDRDRFNFELVNIKTALALFNNAKNISELVNSIWVNPNNPECIGLAKLIKEFPSEKWEITETRAKLSSILIDRLNKIESLYKKKKYKDIKEIGYELHNVPEMMCNNSIFSCEFTDLDIR